MTGCCDIRNIYHTMKIHLLLVHDITNTLLLMYMKPGKPRELQLTMRNWANVSSTKNGKAEPRDAYTWALLGTALLMFSQFPFLQQAAKVRCCWWQQQCVPAVQLQVEWRQTEKSADVANSAVVKASCAVSIDRWTRCLQHCMTADLADTVCSNDQPPHQQDNNQNYTCNTKQNGLDASKASNVWFINKL